MLELILMITLTPISTQSTAQFRPCVWPNKCEQPAAVVAQYQPCVWPNRCAQPEVKG